MASCSAKRSSDTSRTPTDPKKKASSNSAILTLSSSPIYTFSDTQVGSASLVSVTMTNTGTARADSIVDTGVLAAPFRYVGGNYPGTGGTCADSLSTNATCTLKVEFAPTTGGSFTSKISINYADAQGEVANVRLNFAGTATQSQSLLIISDSPEYDWGYKILGSSNDRTFIIINNGAAIATSISDLGSLTPPFDYKDGNYPGTGGSCGATILPGDNCQIVLTFAPTVVGPASGLLEISYSDAVSSKTLSLQLAGYGDVANLLLSHGPTYDYGNVGVSEVDTMTFNLTNGAGVEATLVQDDGQLSAPFNYQGGNYPGTGGTCGASLAAGATCTLAVDFSPPSIGNFTSGFGINYFDGDATQNTQINLSGDGAPAVLSISDGATFDYGIKAPGSVNSQTFVITNTGGATATSIADAARLAAPFDWKDGNFPGTGGSCTATLAPSATCTVIVDFSPVSVGTFSSNIDISYDDGLATQNTLRALSGEAALAELSISDGPTFDYGIQAVPSDTPKTFIVTNIGTVTATAISDAVGLAAPFDYEGAAYPGSSGTCGSTLAAGATCTVVVNFSPSTAAPFSDTLVLNYNDGATAQTESVDVIGTGSSALLTITDSPSYDYGINLVGSSVTRSFTISNSGASSATSIVDGGTLATAFQYLGGNYPGTGGNCGVTLTAGATCTVFIEFSPTAALPYSETLSIDYDDGVANQTLSNGLVGTGALGFLTITDSPSHDFGPNLINTVVERNFTITNTGDWAVSSLSYSASLAAPFSFKGGGGYPGAGGDCGSSLASGASCIIFVEFNPTATGNFTDSIDFTYDDGVAGQNLSLGLDGSGTQTTTLTLSDTPTYDFGSIAVGNTLEHIFTLSNPGLVTATSIANGGTIAAPFRFKGAGYPGTGGSCGSSLGPTANCTLVVEFAPSISGLASGTLDISYDNGQNATSVSVGLNGTALGPAVLSISPGPSFNYGSKLLTSTTDQSFTISNTGGASATSIADQAALAAPFTYVGGNYPGTGGNCGTTLTAGASCTINLRYNPTTAGSHSDTLVISYFNGASTQNLTNDVLGLGYSSTPTQLVWVGPSGMVSNFCGTLTIESRNSSDIAANVGANTTIALSVNNGTGTFYSDSGCTSTATTATINSGTSSVTIYFRSITAPQSLTLIGTNVGYAAASKYLTIGSAATKLVFAVASEVQVGVCEPIDVRRTDATGTAVAENSVVNVNLTQNMSAQYFSDSGCSAQITSTSIASATSEKRIYLKNAMAETVTLTATDAGALLTAGTKGVVFVNTIAWWDTSWQSRIRVTINNLDQATAFSNQAILIKLNAGRLNYARTNNDGSDIRILASDHFTELKHEIETWNEAGDSTIWVKIPSIPASSNSTEIFVYYDNASASSTADATNLWTGWAGVWHLNESPGASGPQFRDRSSNLNHATAFNSPSSIAGPIGNAIDLPGASDALNTTASLHTILGSTSTFSTWMKTSQVGSNTTWLAPGITGVEQSGGGNDIFFGWIDGSGAIGVTSGNGAAAKSNFVVNNNVWRHVTITRNHISGAVKFFINGVLNGSGTSEAGAKTTPFSKFGEIGDTGGTPVNYNGSMDEVRVMTSIKTDADIKADHKFMVDTNLEYSVTESAP